MSKRKVTIEDLAAMVQRGFKEMAKKADMDPGFAAVIERPDRIERLMLVRPQAPDRTPRGAGQGFCDLLAIK